MSLRLLQILLFLPVTSAFVTLITSKPPSCYKPYSSVTTRVNHCFDDKRTTTCSNLNLADNASYSNVEGETLYDILQVNPDSSRVEIKKQYFKLAKTFHPDAQINAKWNIPGSDDPGKMLNANENENRFTEVAIAYKILADPLERKRYDRSLQAEAFTDDVEKAATRIGEKTAMYGKNLFKNVAAPLLRRTSATTAAFIDAASRDLSTQAQRSQDKTTPSLDLSRTVKSALKATMQAGKNIDRIELDEKSRILEMRSIKEQKEAYKIKDEIISIVKSRLLLALKVPNAPFSADEAQTVLEQFNTTDSRSFIESVFSKHTVQHEIELYKFVETEFNRKVQLSNLIERQFFQTENIYAEAQRKEQTAIREVAQYTKELCDAKKRVTEAKHKRVECSRNVTAVEVAKKRTMAEVLKLELAVDKKREFVRDALAKKDEEILMEQRKQIANMNGLPKKTATPYAAMSNSLSKDTIEDQDTQSAERTNNAITQIDGLDITELSPTLDNFNMLRNKERMMKEERLQKENRAARLISRSNKLKERSEILKEIQE